MISTGVAGVASVMRSPAVVEHRLDLAPARPRRRSGRRLAACPFCMMIVAIGPRFGVHLGFDDGAFSGAVGVGLELRDLGDEQDVLEQVVQAGLGLRRDGDGDARRRRILRQTTSCCVSCCLTLSGSAAGRSILLIATIIGTPGRLRVVRSLRSSAALRRRPRRRRARRCR